MDAVNAKVFVKRQWTEQFSFGTDHRKHRNKTDNGGHYRC